MKNFSLFLISIYITASAFAQTTGGVTSKQQGNLRVQDIDGNYYHTVKIGNQIWMAENLKVTKYIDGNEIPMVADTADWSALKTGGYCWYNNNAKNKNTYGAMYNWYTVVDKRKLCPKGWHIPSDSEWSTLVSYLGGTNIAGGKVKEEDTLHWVSPNTGATNESGFTALPGGDRHATGAFYDLGWLGYWWSSTEKDSTTARSIELNRGDSKMVRWYFTMKDGFSVRCVKD